MCVSEGKRNREIMCVFVRVCVLVFMSVLVCLCLCECVCVFVCISCFAARVMSFCVCPVEDKAIYYVFFVAFTSSSGDD